MSSSSELLTLSSSQSEEENADVTKNERNFISQKHVYDGPPKGNIYNGGCCKDLYSCRNCSDLMAKLAECEICMNPLQNANVNACGRCGGLWCGSCAKRVSKCPYCRSVNLRGPCIAINRLLRDLHLPCRNQRWGCQKTLRSENRDYHEAVCEFGQLICPIDDKCEACLPLSAMATHIKKHHSTTAINSGKVNVTIENFHMKMEKTAGTRYKYRLCLMSFDSAFIVKISLFNYSLHVSVTQKHLRQEMAKSKKVRGSYCALIEFQARCLCHRSTILINDNSYTRRTMLQRASYDLLSRVGDDVNIFVTINAILPHEEVVLSF